MTIATQAAQKGTEPRLTATGVRALEQHNGLTRRRSGPELLNTLRNLQMARAMGLIREAEYLGWQATLDAEDRLALADEISASDVRIAAL